jgi:ligand-binding SRPBCC domain-containing protein
MGDVRYSYIVKTTPNQLYDYLKQASNVADQLSESFDVELPNPDATLEQGFEIDWRLTRYGITQPVKISVDEALRGERLSYRQLEGMFRQWRHIVQLSVHDESSTLVTETVHYTLPFGLLGHLVDDLYWNSELRSILEVRSQKIMQIFD